jgi:ABC-type antimicrobial peptide transport system permease subunit
MDENIQSYRSSLVTAIGIILGFVLGFSATWATQPATESDWSDYLIGIGLFISIVLQIIALYRILDNEYPKESAGIYYKKTLKIFILGLIMAFLGIILSIFQSIFTN